MHCMGKGGELRVPEQPSQVLKPGGDAGTQQVWGQDSPSWGWAAPKGSGRLGLGSQAVLRGSPRTDFVCCHRVPLLIVHRTARVRGFETSLSVRIITNHIWNSRTEEYYL